jgi:Ca2+-binding RTX toxin-like protein
MLSGGEGDDSLWGGDVPEEPTTMGTSVENLDGDMLTGGAGADQFFFQDTLETGTASFGGLGSLGSSDVLNQFNDENIVGTSEFAGFAPGTFQVGDYLMDTSNVDYGGTGFWSGTSTNMFDPGSFSGSAQFQTTGHVDTITDFNPTDDQIVLRSGGGFGAGQFTTGNLADIIADGSTPATGGGSFAFGAGTLASIDAVLGSNQFDDVVTGPSGTIQVTGSFGQFFYDTDNTALYYGVGNGSMALLVDFENPEPGFSAADIDFLNDGDINIF